MTVRNDNNGGQLSFLVAAEAGGMSQGLAPVEKTHSLHRLRRSVSGQHAPDDSRSVFHVHRVCYSCILRLDLFEPDFVAFVLGFKT